MSLGKGSSVFFFPWWAERIVSRLADRPFRRATHALPWRGIGKELVMEHFVYCDREWRDGPEWAKPFSAGTVIGVLLWSIVIIFWFWFCQRFLISEDTSFWVRVVIVIGLPAFLIIFGIPHLTLPKGWSLMRGLEHFWKANVLGHTRWFGLKSDGSLVIFDKPYRAPKPKDVVKFWLVIPWGGVFRRTRIFWCCISCPIFLVNAKHRGSSVVCRYKSGQIADMSIQAFFCLMHWQISDCDCSELDRTIDTILSRLRSAEDRCGKHWDVIVQLARLADDAVEKIAATKRFVKSEEGLKIRVWLIRQLSQVLPDNLPELGMKYRKLAENLPPEKKDVAEGT